MQVLAHSLDGCLRITQISKTRGLVEVRSHLYPGSWSRCLRPMALAEAWEFFGHQCVYHSNPGRFFKPVVQPGQ